jgi:hypothetical protein
VQTLITLAAIRDDARKDLDEALAGIAANPERNRHISFADSPSTHFARFVILPDDDVGPRLLFSANYDGGMAAYLDELAAAGPGNDVWGACQGYEGPDRFVGWVRDHYLRPRGVYDAFPGMTVQDVKDRIAIREQIEETLDIPALAELLQRDELRRFLERIRRLPRAGTPTTRLAAAVDEIATNVAGAVRGRALALFLAGARTYARFGQSSTFPLVHEDPTRDVPPDRETAIQTVAIGEGSIQNQMNTVTEVIPEQLPRLQIALVGTDVLTRFGWPPGEFADVGTLHWFAWALFDDLRHLLFMSTFDGSWQNYMQDFINKLVWALDALYSNTRDYPAAGMQDVTAFTDFILLHQHAPAAFYSAYAHESVTNLLRDRAIAKALATRDGGKGLDEWLLLL